MFFDLHCHSHFSDGALSPQELLHLALDNQLEVLALTDHDSVQAAIILQELAHDFPIKIIIGLECSVTYQKKDLHVLGLGVDAQHPDLLRFIASSQTKRMSRANAIAEKLQAIGFSNVLSEVEALAPHQNISRSHFAQYLINCGAVKNKQAAFKQYLSEGKPAFVASQWWNLEDSIAMIHAAGGLAVLAHPLHYQKSSAQLKALLKLFKSCGGDGVEVVSGIQSPKDTQRLLVMAHQAKLLVSSGSDFHDFKPYRASLGRQSILAENLCSILGALSINTV